jgi:peptidoglycan hydrolase-like protein with peptidoglycan-binding domain
MKRSARARSEPTGVSALLREGAALGAGVALRNPMAVGGTTAFLVTLAYVSANAMWYQPYPHPAAYFSTRVSIAPEPERQPAAERFAVPERAPAISQVRRQPQSADDVSALIENQTTGALPAGDPQVRLVQEVLHTLDLYSGPVDGLAGPQTAKAIERYQKIVGLAPSGRIDDALLLQLGAGQAADDGAPRVGETLAPLPDAAPVPRQKQGAATGLQTAAAARPGAAPAGDPLVMRIQAGLRAFGHDAIELDGVTGARTRAAILEFQSLFGLPETGAADERLLAKMREVGLID